MKVILNITYFPVILFFFRHMVFIANQYAYQTRLLHQCKFHATTLANNALYSFYLGPVFIVIVTDFSQYTVILIFLFCRI
jgi:hypothetical protein